MVDSRRTSEVSKLCKGHSSDINSVLTFVKTVSKQVQFNLITSKLGSMTALSSPQANCYVFKKNEPNSPVTMSKQPVHGLVGHKRQ